MNNALTQDKINEMTEAARLICSKSVHYVSMSATLFGKVWLDRMLFNMTNEVAVEWVKKVAGHWYNEVILVDDNGNKVALVPAMMNSTSQYFSKNFDVTVHMYRIRGAAHSGNPYKVNNLYNELYDHVNENPTPVNDLQKWIELAKYYQVTPEWLSGFAVVVENNITADSTSSNNTDNNHDAVTIEFIPV